MAVRGGPQLVKYARTTQTFSVNSAELDGEKLSMRHVLTITPISIKPKRSTFVLFLPPKCSITSIEESVRNQRTCKLGCVRLCTRRPRRRCRLVKGRRGRMAKERFRWVAPGRAPRLHLQHKLNCTKKLTPLPTALFTITRQPQKRRLFKTTLEIFC